MRIREQANQARTSRLFRVAFAACLAPSLSACGDGSEAVTATRACVTDGTLETELHGSVEARLAWRGGALECEGMPRPHGAGARLRFADTATIGGEERRIAFIIALPDLEPGGTRTELPASVTMIEEDAGRFFSTREANVCWADIERQDALEGGPASSRYAISGLLYCVEPLAELNGNGSVMLGDLRFSGKLDWEPPE